MEQECLTSMNKTLNNETICGNEQSTLHLTVSVIFYVIQCVLLPLTLYVNILVLRMLKRENLFVSMEIKIYCIYNIIESIIGLVHHGILKFAFPASVHIGPWYCHAFSVIMTIGTYRVLIHSLTLSVYRYIYIIYREKLTTEKRRNQVTWLVLLVKWFAIFIFSTKFVIFGIDEFVLFWTSFCDGSYINPPTKQANSSTLEYVGEHIFYRLSKDDDRAIITIFGNVHGGLVYVLQAYCVIVDVFIMITCFNLMEGFLYSKIAKYMKS